MFKTIQRKCFLLISLLLTVSVKAQTTEKMENKTNPLLCDPIEGICGVPDSSNSKIASIEKNQKSIKLIYFTDPICSSCWGIEPQLRKLKLEYGASLQIEYRMGGLLPDWSYNSGGISKPSDVAHHWDEVSVYYDMPIDGDVWLEDPLNSSYPPSIAFKAAQMQDEKKAVLFLREIREMIFLHKLNITKWNYLEQAAKKVGLDIAQFKQDYESKANVLFEEDLKLAKEWGVRGFPTLIFTDSTGKKETVYGSKPYEEFENAILKLDPTCQKYNYEHTLEAVFLTYPTLTAKEFSELTTTPRKDCERMLEDQVKTGKLEKFSTKNGAIWKMKK